MNGIELGALRRMLHISKKDAALINEHRPEMDWTQWESSRDLVPDSVALEVFDWANRYVNLLDSISMDDDPSAAIAELQAMLDDMHDGQYDDVLDDSQKTLFDRLVNAAIGNSLLVGDLEFERNGDNLRRMRRSLLLSQEEAAAAIGNTTSDQWAAWENDEGDEIPGPIWDEVLVLGDMRTQKVVEVTTDFGSDVVASICRTAYAVWYERLEDFRQFTHEDAEIHHLRATQSALAELFARLQEQFRTILFDAQEYAATPGQNDEQFTTWMQEAAEQENEARQARKRAERSLFGIGSNTVN